jgi:HAE1 family hydrophobic/amphiphilic exporter-1
MSLPELCIKRPVFTTMLILLPVTLGLFSYMRMGVDLFPNVDLPIVTVTTTRSGTSVEEMESGVTKPLEEVVNTISGIDELRSTTKEGISTLNIIFVLEKNRDVAQQEVQGKINTILSRLPTGTDAPIIDKFDIDASPVMTVAVSGRRPLREITEIADKQVKDTLSSLSGVGSVSLVGGRKRAINVTVNARKLESYNLSIEQVRAALANQNLELPGGRVDQNSRELVLRTMGRVENLNQFNDIIVANVAGQPIRIRDVGTVDDSYEEPRSIGRLDGDNSVLLVVQKQSGTNTVAVIDTVKAKLAQLSAGFAQEGRGDLRLEVIRDQSRFINSSMDEVKKHLVLGAILVSLTILLFLRDWRTMVIASISIPVSLISTFMVMKWMGFTLNNITMLAMVLAVGIVIDDAVVVHENIFRWMEEKGMNAWNAAMGATREITLAVMATTFSLVVIFLPIAFMEGRVGRFFFSFGITTAIAILMSMLVSFTLTPMLCSRFLRLSEKAKREGKAHHSGGIYGWLVEQPYLLALRWSMRHRWAVMLTALLVVLSMFPIPPLRYPGLVKMVGLDFIPKDDQSEFEIAITTPEGWTLDRTDQTFREIESKLKNMRGVLNIMTAIGDTSGRFTRAQGEVTRGSIYVRLTDLKERDFSQFDVMADARRMLASYPDLRTSVQLPAAISSGQVNADVEFTLVGPDLAKLGHYSDQMIERLRTVRGLTDVDTTLALRKPEMRIEIDRNRASDLGVSVQTVASTLGIFVGGQVVSDFRDNQMGELYDVWLRAAGANRDDPQAVANLTIPSTKAGLVKLGNVANIGEARGPSQIDRYARQRKISIVANLAGMPTNVAQQTFLNTFAELNAGPQYSLLASGRAKTQNESNAAFVMAFAFSLIFMYMILAAQFESFVHPIAILMSVPVTIPFALLSLILLGQSMTIYSILGIFLLFGIVKKNGILQVDYSNVLRQKAKENADEVPDLYRRNGRHDGQEEMSGWKRWVSRLSLWAILEANRTRLRPILMTTLMLIAGMVPIAMGEGPGAANRASMAKVIVGGQALSLLLSLLITPVGYSLLDDLALWRRNWRKPKSTDTEAEPLQLDRPVPAEHVS